MTKTHTVRLTSEDIFKIGDALNRRRQELQDQIAMGYPLELEAVWRVEIEKLAIIRDGLLLAVTAHDAAVAERAAGRLLAA